MPEQEDAMVAACVLFARDETGEQVSPTKVRLRRPRPHDAAPYDELFQCSVEFGAARTAITYTRDALAMPLKSRLKEVAHCLVLAADTLMTRLRRTVPLRSTVLTTFEEVGTEQKDVADRLGLSVRTLQRKLLDEGVRYQTLIDVHRQRRATMLMQDPSLTVVQVAHQSGFSDVRALRRSLRKWRSEAAQRGDVDAFKGRSRRGSAPPRRYEG